MKQECKGDSCCLSKGTGLEAIMPDPHLTAGPVSLQPGHPETWPPHDWWHLLSECSFCLWTVRSLQFFSSFLSLTLKYPDKTIIIVNNLS